MHLFEHHAQQPAFQLNHNTCLMLDICPSATCGIEGYWRMVSNRTELNQVSVRRAGHPASSFCSLELSANCMARLLASYESTVGS